MTAPTPTELIALLDTTLEARSSLLDASGEAAVRLFNGFSEGDPDLAVDLYGRTLLLHNYAAEPAAAAARVQAAQDFYLERLPWLDCVVLKTRRSPDPEARRGQVIGGGRPATQVREHGVRYALDLRMNRDASLYLDTRNLRGWALANLTGQRVLNTFAYTGSLGVAALAGGAARVVQLDRNRAFLELARRSCRINNLPANPADFLSADFFPQVSRFRREDVRFDCIFLDPPFFSTTAKGVVDLVNESTRLINKVRPLVADGGRLVAINNALFLSGADYLAGLEGLMKDGYVSLEEIIPIPADFAGYPHTIRRSPPVDPAPFNHPTKVVVLNVRRKEI